MPLEFSVNTINLYISLSSRSRGCKVYIEPSAETANLSTTSCWLAIIKRKDFHQADPFLATSFGWCNKFPTRAPAKFSRTRNSTLPPEGGGLEKTILSYFLKISIFYFSSFFPSFMLPDGLTSRPIIHLAICLVLKLGFNETYLMTDFIGS